MSRFLRSGTIGAALLALSLMAGCSNDKPPAQANLPSGQQSAAGAPVPMGTGFDFYVLALSWSPSYCAAEGEGANRQQCGGRRPYGFVVHGLWPQFERGYPSECRTTERQVPRDTMAGLHDIMPSDGLIGYQWRKHGSCSGLDQDDYFAVLRAARERVVVPTEFARLQAFRSLDPEDAERAFLQSNPDLDPKGVAVTCDRRYLREVRICMTRDLEFRACPEVDRTSCRRDTVVMPPMRGS